MLAGKPCNIKGLAALMEFSALIRLLNKGLTKGETVIFIVNLETPYSHLRSWFRNGSEEEYCFL